MRIFDAHCDTICKLFDNKSELYSNNYHIDLRKMSMYSGYTQVFAAYSDPEHSERMLERDIELIDYLVNEIEKNEEHIMLCRNGEDLKKAKRDAKMAAFIALEGADAIKSMSILRTFYRLGVRVISPVWNVSNHIATSITDKDSKKGLTEFGREMFKEMDNLGIVADVSHASDRTFWDIFDNYTGTIIATHSNSREIAAHNRNLSDIQFTAIARAGGCVGINLYPFFLSLKPQAAVEDIVRHIEHFCSLDGENHIGLGCDFDGVDILPEEIVGAESLWKIFNALSMHGYSDATVRKIAYQNFERVFSEIK